MSPRLAVALVHYPCLDKSGAVYTTSITNLDVHDIARSSRTYGGSAYYVVTPVQAQQQLAASIASFWETDPRGRKVPTRADAMRLVRVAPSLEEAIVAETAALGARPLVVATSARESEGALSWAATRARFLEGAGMLLVLGTGYGLAPAALALCDGVIAPIHGVGEYNHLSVRSAAAIALDRLCSPDHQSAGSSSSK